MEISQITLLRLLIYSFLFGAIVGVLYDANKVIRVLFGVRYTKKLYSKLYALKRPITKKGVNIGSGKGICQSIVVNVGDFLCVIIAAIGAILLNYGYNSGRFRIFTLAAIALGFFIYRFSIGRAIIFFAEPVAFICKYLLLSICDILCFPLKKLYVQIRKIAKKISSLYIFTLEKRKKKLYNIRDEEFFVAGAQNSASDGSKKSRWRYKQGGKADGKQ